MGQSNLGKAIGLILAIPVALLIGLWVLTNPTGAISGLSKMLAFALAFIALVNPRLGLLLLIPQVLYTDEIKRLAVSYGVASYTTVYEVLLGPILTIAMLNAGYIVGATMGRYSLPRKWVVGYAIIALISLIIMATSAGSFATRAQVMLNTGLYMTLVPLMAGLLDTKEEAHRMLKWQIWWTVPSALWGIQQYYFGLNTMEIDYARTGLSATHLFQVLLMDNPRPFGFFGSSTGFGVIGIYAGLVVAYLIWNKQGKLCYLLLAAIYAWAIFASRQRTILLLVPMIIVASFLFYTRARTWFFYSLAVLTFVSGVYYSEKLMYGGLDRINKVIATTGPWGREVLNVNTFSDRLRGWSRLKKASSYTLFGAAQAKPENYVATYTDEDYSHDVINVILIKSGVLGLLASLMAAGYVLIKLHGMILRIPEASARREAAYLLSAVLLVVFLSLTAGNVLATNPFNLVVWSLVGAFVVIAKKSVAVESRFEVEEPVAGRTLPGEKRMPFAAPKARV